MDQPQETKDLVTVGKLEERLALLKQLDGAKEERFKDSIELLRSVLKGETRTFKTIQQTLAVVSGAAILAAGALTGFQLFNTSRVDSAIHETRTAISQAQTEYSRVRDDVQRSTESAILNLKSEYTQLIKGEVINSATLSTPYSTDDGSIYMYTAIDAFPYAHGTAYRLIFEFTSITSVEGQGVGKLIGIYHRLTGYFSRYLSSLPVRYDAMREERFTRGDLNPISPAVSITKYAPFQLSQNFNVTMTDCAQAEEKLAEIQEYAASRGDLGRLYLTPVFERIERVPIEAAFRIKLAPSSMKWNCSQLRQFEGTKSADRP